MFKNTFYGCSTTFSIDPEELKAKGYSSANFTIAGTDFPAVQDILSDVVDKGIGQSDRDMRLIVEIDTCKGPQENRPGQRARNSTDG